MTRSFLKHFKEISDVSADSFQTKGSIKENDKSDSNVGIFPMSNK